VDQAVVTLAVHEKRFWLAALWLVIVLPFLVVYTIDLGLSYRLLAAPCDGVDCHYQAIGSEEAALLTARGLTVEGYALYMLGITVLVVAVFTILALVMARRLFPQPRGLLFSAVLVIIPTTAITSFDVVAAAFPSWSVPVNLLFVVGLAASFSFFLVFPNGRFAPRGSLVLLLLLAAVYLADFLIESYRPYRWLPYLSVFFAFLVVIVYRYRRLFDRSERQQARWVVFGCIVFFTGIPVWGYTFEWAQPATGREHLLLVMGGWTLTNLLTLGLPVSIFAAILRNRLWDIDLILRKTLVYALLTAVLVVAYSGSVALMQNLFAASTGQNSPLVNVISTLIIAALFQPVRERLQRATNRLFFGERDDPYVVLSKLDTQLQDAAAPDQTLTAIVNTLCERLKLPYAAIIVETANGKRNSVASSGEWVAGAREWPLRYQGLPLGWLEAAPREPGETFTAQEERLLADVASHAGAAVHAAQLASTLQNARERLVLSREEERRRIRRDLHDGLGPTLASQTFALDAAIDLLENDPPAAAEVLRKLKAQNQVLVADIRRLVYELRPPSLDELGLPGAIETFLQQINNHSPTQVYFRSDSGALADLPAAVEAAVYRLVQEGVNNVLRHAQAQTCTVECQRSQGWLTLKICDDGRGIPANALGGVGLRSMRERAEELGGSFTIAPVQPAGTILTALLPTGF
jgi:signal transduction histidine kinase